MEAIRELNRVKASLEGRQRAVQAELDTVNRTIQILQREQQLGVNGSQAKTFAKSGLSNSCREIVKSDFRTAVEVRDQLMQGGYKSSGSEKMGKLLNSVYATLNRLAKNGELEVQNMDGKRAFRKKQTAGNE